MPTINKLSLIFRFQQSTDITPLIAPRTAGWTESFWVGALPNQVLIGTFATARAALMCPDCAITGFRITPYTYAGNKIQPGKSSVGTYYVAGKFNDYTNSPDDTLRMRCTAGGIPVTFTMFLHAIPDKVISSGSFIQDNNFQRFLGSFTDWITGQRGLPASQWLGRDPTRPSQQVVSVNIVAGTLVTAQPVAGAIAGQYLRLRRVYDDSGNPIKGSFFIVGVVVNANGTATYTLQGLPNLTRTTPSGTARQDLIAQSSITLYNPQLIASRKVGRPSLLYRGRRGKTRP